MRGRPSIARRRSNSVAAYAHAGDAWGERSASSSTVFHWGKPRPSSQTSMISESPSNRRSILTFVAAACSTALSIASPTAMTTSFSSSIDTAARSQKGSHRPTCVNDEFGSLAKCARYRFAAASHPAYAVPPNRRWASSIESLLAEGCSREPCSPNESDSYPRTAWRVSAATLSSWSRASMFSGNENRSSSPIISNTRFTLALVILASGKAPSFLRSWANCTNSAMQAASQSLTSVRSTLARLPRERCRGRAGAAPERQIVFAFELQNGYHRQLLLRSITRVVLDLCNPDRSATSRARRRRVA